MSSRPRPSKLRLVILTLGVCLGVAGLLAYRYWLIRGISPVERGRRVAAQSGCFGCHGPGGVSGFEDPAGITGGVPPFDNAAVEGHAKTVDEIREWILDGKPKRIRDEEQAEPSEHDLMTMPAYRGRLGTRDVADLIAFVRATSDFQASQDPAATAGRATALRLGCFTCHGPQGRGTPANPGSLKGYIPSWDGTDFPDLVESDDELREWIQDGSPKRLREHPIAKIFIDRQVIKMPAYREKLSAEDLDQLVAYVRWLRTSAEAAAGG